MAPELQLGRAYDEVRVFALCFCFCVLWRCACGMRALAVCVRLLVCIAFVVGWHRMDGSRAYDEVREGECLCTHDFVLMGVIVLVFIIVCACLCAYDLCAFCVYACELSF